MIKKDIIEENELHRIHLEVIDQGIEETKQKVSKVEKELEILRHEIKCMEKGKGKNSENEWTLKEMRAEEIKLADDLITYKGAPQRWEEEREKEVERHSERVEY